MFTCRRCRDKLAFQFPCREPRLPCLRLCQPPRTQAPRRLSSPRLPLPRRLTNLSPQPQVVLFPFDQAGETAFSDTSSFLLDYQQSPGPFSLVNPPDGSEVDSLRPQFVWRMSIDPDPRDTVLYTLTVFSAVDTDSVVYFAAGLLDTSHTVQEDIKPGSYKWRVIARDTDHDSLDTPSTQVFSIRVLTAIDDELAALPSEYNLSQNYPNPFNPTTTINYALPLSSEVLLVIYNLRGEEVARVVDKEQPAGYHKVTWNASNVASGIYFYRLQAGDFVQTYKMLLLK